MLYVEWTTVDGRRVYEWMQVEATALAWVAVLNARRPKAKAVVVRVEGGRREEVGR